MNREINVITSKDVQSPWMILSDGYFRRNVERQMLKDGMSQDAIDSVFNNAARILQHCPNPVELENVSRTGIVIGKVQSGKTSNFISVLSLAFDNKYNVAVVLGGNTLELLKQNASRISSAFNVDPEKLTVLKTNDNKSLINPERIREFIENGRKVIIVGLKHHKHIDQIAEIFDNAFLADQPVLIVDDEGDQATLNTKAYIDSMSSTYESVLNLKSKTNKHCFLSVTATPQANILIKAFDTLSPDFGELVYPGEGYCGLKTFHGENADIYVKEIPPEEGNLLDVTGVPQTVYNAIAAFFVGNAIRRSRGDSGTHAMLIHPSQKKYDHRIVEKKIQGILSDWKDKAKMRLTGRNDISYLSLQKTLMNAYDSFVKDGVQCVPFSELELTILDRIKECSPVHICNSDENASENALLYKTNIFVGGNLVERGLTIKGLAVTYITRRAKGKSNVDNTEQRARWFGYKAQYIDVCRVFTTKDIKDDFESILEHDEDMWALIERAQEKGIAFKDMPRVFKLTRSSYISLTRKNVARTEQMGFDDWKPQKYYIADEAMANKNVDIILNFRENHSAVIETVEFNAVQKHAYLRCIKYDELYKDMLSKIQTPEEEELSKEFFSALKEAFSKLEMNPDVDLVWVRDENHQERKILPDGSIQQLFQGRNPNVNSPTYYVGDRRLADNTPDRIQIQIHMVKPSNKDLPDTHYSPAIAIYMPEWCAEKLEKLVVRSND